MAGDEPRAFVDGKIFTGEGWVRALLVEEGRVSALGTSTTIRALRPPGTRTTDLRGALVFPGLVDAHVHLRESVLQAEGVALQGCRRWSEVEHRLSVEAVRHARGPLWGGGWDQERMPGRAWPTREWLDRAVPDRPVVLDRVCRHVAVVNSAALDALGIDARTPDPPGGRIGRDAAGEPDGLLFENALSMTAPLRRTAFRARPGGLARLLRTWARRGVTSVGAMNLEREELGWLSRASPGWPVRVRAFLPIRQSAEAVPGRRPGPHDRFRLVGAKAHLDGSLGARTAWLEQAYTDAPGSSGLAIWSPAELGSLAETALGRGFRLALHAIGDRALAEAVRLLRGLRAGARARIEHASLVPARWQAPLRALGCPVVIQPGFRRHDHWLRARLGPTRARSAYPFSELLRAGVRLVASSDAPVEPVDPWTEMRFLAQAPRWGSAPGRLAPRDSLALYTTAAGAAIDDPLLGRLAREGPGDLVVTRACSWSELIGSARPIRAVFSAGTRVG